MTRLLPIAALLMLMPMLAAAHEYRAGTLLIEHPWARATPKGAEVGGGYMKVVNEGKQADRLIGASLALAQKTEIHAMKMENGVMQMRPATQGLEIKPGATLEFNPESFHLMFEGLRQPLTQGQHVEGTLVFEKAGTVKVVFFVEGIGAHSPQGAASGSKSGVMSHMEGMPASKAAEQAR
ncbi:MAG TPA: copper chaperone PCu(A)C [Xanthobacteraceae bacterium]|nr:copper chaperone PCu(A)C [Xanthobacteraceae bacterium]